MIITCEVDTDTKKSKVMVDGNEVPALEFSVSHYVYKGCSADPEDIQDCTYISLTQGDVEEKQTYSYSFSNGKNPSYSESMNKTSYSREVEKVVKNAIASEKLGKALSNKNKK